MRAITVIPHKSGSMRLDTDLPEPEPADGDVVVEGRFIGVCGTDHELREGAYGWAPPGRERLVIGHESLGVVRSAPAGSGLSAGDLVAGIVRRPDPVPCPACAAGQFDFCRNGQYVEHGIKSLDGFGREVWTAQPDAIQRIDPSLGDLGVLMEPTSVVAKGWDQTDKISSRAFFAPQRLLVTGAGTIGLLATLMGRNRGMTVDVLDRGDLGPKRGLVEALGGTYHDSPESLRNDYDVVMECTGVGSVVFDVIGRTGAPGVVCLLGVSGGGSQIKVDPSTVNNELVLENDVIFGSVNANKTHWEIAAKTLAAADKDWLAKLVSRKVPMSEFDKAFQHAEDDVKVVIDLQR